MYRKAGVVLVAMGLLFILVGAGLVAKKEVELNLVREKEFEKKIEEVAFGETEDGKLYPKFVVFEDEVRFYDEDYRLISTQPCEKHYTRGVVLSEKSNHVGICTMLKTPTKEEDGQIRFIIYTNGGKKLWEKVEEVHYDIPSPSYYLSDLDGSVVEVYYGTGILLLYNRQGQIIKRSTLFKSKKWADGKDAVVVFSENGQYFAALAMESVGVPLSNKRPGKSGNPTVIMYDSKGNELWRYKLSHSYGREISMSYNGDYIIAYGSTSHLTKGLLSESAYLLNKKGELLAKFEVGKPGNISAPKTAFSHYGHLASVVNQDEIGLINLEKGEMLWKQTFPEVKGYITAVRISTDGERILVQSGSKGYEAGKAIPGVPQILILNREGEIIGRRLFEKEPFKIASVEFSSNRKIIGIGLPKRIAIFNCEN